MLSTSKTLALFVVAISITSALPTLTRDTSGNPQNFLLVTTTSSSASAHSSNLPNVSATTYFDPYHQTTFLLRTIAPGYGSLPLFNLTDGTLQTPAYVFNDNDGTVEYNSTIVIAGEELGFEPDPQPDGNLVLKDGYLLTVGGDAEGWTLCNGPIDQTVVSTCQALCV